MGGLCYSVGAIPLVSWDPVGPPVGFALYHNNALAAGLSELQAAAAAPFPNRPSSRVFPAPAAGLDPAPEAAYDASVGQGFDLGPGWSASYSARVIPLNGASPGTGDVVVVDDDGSWDVFRFDGAAWTPPPGVHDRLTWDDVNDTWSLRSTSQWVRKFKVHAASGGNPGTGGVGLLSAIIDSAGNELTVVRDEGEDYRITEVLSAADGQHENKLTLTFDDAELDTITDPIGRTWTLTYTLKIFEAVEYPSIPTFGHTMVVVDYATDGRLASIVDRDELTWTYGYSNGRLVEVTDPAGDINTSSDDYAQAFSGLNDETCSLVRTYVDRRLEEWKFRFELTAWGRRLTTEIDPDLGDTQVEFDRANNVTIATDELGHAWIATYGPIGNLLTLTSPLTSAAQTWTLTWEEIGNAPETNFYRLIKVEDPLDHWIEYEYDDDQNEPHDPTLVVKSIEMPDGEGNGAAETTFEYWDTEEAYGQLFRVTDANGVQTRLYYGSLGFLHRIEEGLEPPVGASLILDPPDVYPTVVGPLVVDSVGRTTGGESDLGAGAACSLDANDNAFTCRCGGYDAGNFGGPPPDPQDVHPFRMGDQPSPLLNALGACDSAQDHIDADWDPVSRPISAEQCSPGLLGRVRRDRTFEYDDLKRLVEMEVESNAGLEFGRPTTFDAFDGDGNVLSMTGPDGQQTVATYDALGRVKTVRRVPLNGEPEMAIEYVYDAAGRVESVLRGPLGDPVSVTEYFYDEANRIEEIQHQDGASNALMSVVYTWRLDNVITQKVETDYTVTPNVIVTTNFTYDDRQRLIGEESSKLVGQTQTTDYALAYTYDQLGNRLTKYDGVSDLFTRYHYDTDVSESANLEMPYPFRNNRLLKYDVFVEDDEGDLLRTVRYTYYKSGAASNITIKDHYVDETVTPAGSEANYDWYRDLALYYNNAGQLAFVLPGKYKDTGFDANDDGRLDPDPATYTMLEPAQQFNYDAPWQRFLRRQINVDQNPYIPASQPAANCGDIECLYWGVLSVEADDWTDHQAGGWGGSWAAYNDYVVTNTDTEVEKRRYLGGFEQHVADPDGTPPGAGTLHRHEDLVGTTTLTTDAAAAFDTGPASAVARRRIPGSGTEWEAA